MYTCGREPSIVGAPRRGAGGGAKTCDFETQPRAAGDSCPPDTPIRSQPVVGVRLLGLAATGGRVGRMRATPISSRRTARRSPRDANGRGWSICTPLAALKTRFPLVPVNDPYQSHTHRGTPRVVRQPSETVLYREF